MPSFSLVKRFNNRQQRLHRRVSPTSNEQQELEDDSKKTHGKSYAEIDERNLWIPNVSTAFKLLMSLRLSAAIWSNISDCDETYNYWEPLHLILYGNGLQTWEYSPVFAIRSYAYVWLHAAPIQLFQAILPTKLTAFYFLRCFLAFCSAVVETYLYKSISERLSRNVARIFLALSVCSIGMYISVAAFLPSSFSMIINMLAVAFWLQQHRFWSIFCTAFSALIGWPFAAVLGLPIVGEMLLQRREWKTFLWYALIAGVSIAGVQMQIDSYYYGRPVLAPLNIVLYNVFQSSGGGSTLYGTEPLSYYIVNCLLNFNIVAILAVLAFPATLATFWLCYRPAQPWSAFIPVTFLLSSMWLWIVIFFKQPHKEERFLFPIYPLICFSAALTFDCADRIVARFRLMKWQSVVSGIQMIFICAYAMLCLSRGIALYRNYHAPFDVYVELGEQSSNFTMKGSAQRSINVCVGKEWYRFPSAFFLPKDNWKLRFLKSEFRGLLPKYYADLPIPETTRLVPDGMNDLNQEVEDRYVGAEDCHFLVDLDNLMPTDLEPAYSRDRLNWNTISCKPFLLATRSHRFYRAFYVPIMSDRYSHFGDYCLLRRNK